MSPLSIVALCNLFVIAIAIALNAAGVYGLSNMKSNRTFQKLILINLSIGEIVVCVIGFPYFVLVSIGTDPNSHITEALFGIATSFRYALYLMMTFLTLDRLLACKLHISYKQVLTRRVVYTILAASWATGGAVSIADLLSATNITKQYSRIIVVTLDSIFLCLVGITYTYILRRILENRHLAENDPSKNQCDKRKAKFFKVISVIILTFTFLVAIPDIGVAIVQMKCKCMHFFIELLHKGVTGLFLLALPMTYIFANKETRVFLAKKLSFASITRKKRDKDNSQIEERDTSVPLPSQI